MASKIKNVIRSLPFRQLSDIRSIGLMVFGVIVLLVTWSGIKVIQTNYELQKRISKLEQQNEVRDLENANLRLGNAYFNTDQYLELAARRYFGMAAPGEVVLAIPKEVALAHTVDMPAPPPETKVTEEVAKSWYQRNFEAWMEFLFRKNAVRI